MERSWLAPPRSLAKFLVWLVMAALGEPWISSGAPPGDSAPGVAGERVIAAMLIQLTRFVEWPGEAFTPGAPFSLCTTIQDRSVNYVEEAIQNEQIGGRPIAFRRLNGLHEAAGCHVLMTSIGSGPRFAGVTGPVLTVGTEPGFVDAGGMVELSIDRGRVAFELNVKAADQGRLRFSSRLLALARNKRRKTP